MTPGRRPAAALLAVLLVAAFAVASGAAAPAVAAAPGCLALQVSAPGLLATSVVSRVDVGTGARAELGGLGMRVNAIGYAQAQGLGYGIGVHGVGPLGVAHVVTVGHDGRLTDLGPLRAGGPLGIPLGGLLLTATAGAVVGDRLYVVDSHILYTVDIGPAGPDRLRVVGRVLLHTVPLPIWLADVDDLDVGPGGLLYGVAVGLLQPATIVAVDPGNGVVRRIAASGLPASARYGSAVVVGSALHVIANNVGGRSRLYRVALDGSTTAELASWPAVVASDAAGCLRATAPPPPPPPPAPPASTPRPTTPPVGTTTTPPASAPGVSPPAGTAPGSTAASLSTPPGVVAPPGPPGVAPPPGPRRSAVQSVNLAAERPAENEVVKLRRWAITTVLFLLVGAGVAAKLTARGRRS